MMKNILSEVKALFKNPRKGLKKDGDLDKFYDGFRNGIQEVKSSIADKAELKEAKTWLAEISN